MWEREWLEVTAYIQLEYERRTVQTLSRFLLELIWKECLVVSNSANESETIFQ